MSSKSAHQVADDRNTENGNSSVAVTEIQEHGLPQKAVEIARPFGFPITNSMIVSWIVALGLIILARVATRNMKGIPLGAQNLLEWLVGGLYDFLDASYPALGKQIAEKKQLDDALRASARKVLDEFKAKFLAERKAATAKAS